MVLFFCATMAKAGKFTIDFNQPDGNPKTFPVSGGLDWRPLQGEWTVKNKKYHQQDVKFTSTADCTTYHRSYIGNESWSDYTVEAKVRIEEGGPVAPIVGIFFRSIMRPRRLAEHFLTFQKKVSCAFFLVFYFHQAQ